MGGVHPASRAAWFGRRGARRLDSLRCRAETRSPARWLVGFLRRRCCRAGVGAGAAGPGEIC